MPVTGSRSQSAMEYMMTYSWAILMIAVVIGALYSLGLLNPITYAPRANPGGCQVRITIGPVGVKIPSLVGVCTNTLPKYVAQFNGQSVITLSNNGLMSSNSFTVSLWIFTQSDPYFNGEIGFVNASTYGWQIDSAPPGTYNGVLRYRIDTSGYLNQHSDYPANLNLKNGKWHFGALVFNRSVGSNGWVYLYFDGAMGWNSPVYSGPMPIGGMVGTIGSPPLGGGSFNGLLSNVQIYDTALTPNDISALYIEGIGGTPINIKHITGWWPLNGNANDYSGNGYSGIPVNVIYTDSWTNGYALRS